uniref:Crp/Fnr family transcriptional regulator n=1 Tax=Bacteroides thetaiotaomicron TaxID=818 RepID=UPI00359C3AD2
MDSTIATLIENSVNIENNLNRGLMLTIGEKQFFNEHFEREIIKKNGYLIKEGEREKYLYFIEDGMVRYWTTNMKLREITFWFSFSNEFANSYLSLMQNEPSAFTVQTLCDSVVWKIKTSDLALIYDESLNTNKIARIVMEDIFTRKIKREISLLKLSPEDRYQELIKYHKKLIYSIPLKYLASYLGITPQALSRIRGRIS